MQSRQVIAGRSAIGSSATTNSETGSSIGRALSECSLSLVLVALFIVLLSGQALTGWHVYNEEQQQHGGAAVAFLAYLTSGHFLEATFENWESEFLQMGMFVLLTVKLYQKGSSESKSRDERHPTEEDPRAHRSDPNAPWPVRRGGLWLALYERSLSIALFAVFVASFALHAASGLSLYNEERAEHGQPAADVWGYVGSSTFWFESFQNWQSEFLAVLAIVVLTIFLRQRGSPQSKPVAAPYSENGD